MCLRTQMELNLGSPDEIRGNIPMNPLPSRPSEVEHKGESLATQSPAGKSDSAHLQTRGPEKPLPHEKPC